MTSPNKEYPKLEYEKREPGSLRTLRTDGLRVNKCSKGVSGFAFVLNTCQNLESSIPEV